MVEDSTPSALVGPAERLLMIVGSYGSGKTEICVNLAIELARTGLRVQLADLDIVNPYFRSREARALMQLHGIRVVVPPGAQVWADLPIVVREIQGLLRPEKGTISIFDVGGDDVGARVLSSFRPNIADDRYQLWQVINSRRPFTGTVEACLEMRQALEHASRLRVTGFVANSHLIEETTPDVVLEGWRLTREVARQTDLPVRCVAAREPFARSRELAGISAPLLHLQRHMLPPWLMRREHEAERAPAARPVPIGKPGPVGFDGSDGG
jgi:hypothetical protein